MWRVVARVILRYRALFVWLIVAITFFMVQQSKHAGLSHSMARLLPKDSDTQLDYDYFVERFGQRDNAMVLGVKDESFFQLEHFQAWQALVDSVRQLEGVEAVVSITDVVDLDKDTEAKTFVSKSVFEAINTQEQLDLAQARFQDLPFYEGMFVNGDAYAMVLTLDKEVISSRARVPLIEKIEYFGSQYAAKLDVKVHYAGLPYLRTVNSELIRKEIGLFIFLAMLVTAIILYMFFKSFKAMLISMLVVAIGVVWSFGTLGIFRYEMTILSALIPPLLIVIGVPNCIFLINKYHNEYKSHGNKAKALTRMIRKIGNVTILTNATTASGFATFILTSSKDLREFGLVASLNIFAVFILSLLLIPIIFSYLNPPKDKHVKHLDRKWMNTIIDTLIYWVTHRRTIVYVWTVILVTVGSVGVMQMHTTGNVTDDIPEESPLYQGIKFFEEQFRTVLPFEIVIDTHRKNGMTKLSTLRRLDELQDTLASYEEFSRSLSLLDVVKFSKQAFYNGNKDFYDLPNSQEKNWLLSYAKNSAEQDSWANLYVDEDRQVGRVSVQITDLGTSEMHRLKEKLRQDVDKIFDPEKYDVKLTGTSVVFLEGTRYLVKNLFTSLFLAVMLISVFMAWMFNSFRMVVVSLVPNLIPLLLTAAIMGYFGIAIKPSTILVFSIAFGISVDDTIHFLAKYRQELKARKYNIRSSVLAAIRETGVSMIYTSIVLFFGFFIFIASQFGGTVALGLLVSLTLMIAMLSNLLVLPALLLTLEKSITTEAFREPLIDVFDEEEDIELGDLTVKTTEE
jgi:predicted RND superfamily exporter protein